MRVVVGRIGRAHGIKGDVSVEVRTDEPERRFALGAVLHGVLLQGGNRTLTVSSARWHSGRMLLSFAEVPDRTAAELLGGTLLEAEIDPDELPSDAGEFYDRQLIGLDVRSMAGDAVGTITSVVHHDEQDTLVVRGEAREILVPFVTAIVPTVDLAGGFVVVADVPGLLDPDAAESAGNH